MACPPWPALTKPILQLANDGEEHRTSDEAEAIADRLNLTDEDRRETISSGGRRFNNRLYWAVSHLVKAELLEKTKRGHYRITEAGRAVVAADPPLIDDAYFRQNVPAWRQNWDAASARNQAEGEKTTGSTESTDPDPSTESPEERMESANDEIRAALADEILAAVKDQTPTFFEELVVRVIVKMGYGGTLRDAGQALGRSGDGGVDGIIKEDRLGLDTIYLQAKRYTDVSVGRPEVQAFVGALQGVRARKGIFITTSTFASTAKEYVQHIDTKVVLIDGQTLANYMIDFGVGVTTVNTYEVKRIDSDFFVED